MKQEIKTALGLIGEAINLIQGVIDDREEYFEGKSEKWQESPAGEDYSDQTRDLEERIFELEEVIAALS